MNVNKLPSIPSLSVIFLTFALSVCANAFGGTPAVYESFKTLAGPLAREGDLMVVGDAGYDRRTESRIFYNVGAARVYVRRGDSDWEEVAFLSADDGTEGDFFGSAVAIDNGRILVGAVGVGSGSYRRGAAYLFEPSVDGDWHQSHKFTTGWIGSGAQLADSMEFQGNTVVLAAPGAISPAGTARASAGVVVVYQQLEDQSWEATQTLTGDFADRQENFGSSIDLQGDRMIIGAVDDSGIDVPPGSAYIFERDETGFWSKVQRIQASDGQSRDQFGYSVGLNGDRVIVGAPHTYPLEVAGSAYIFDRDLNGNWIEAETLTSFDSEESTADHFGVKVKLLEDGVAIVGAPIYDNYHGAAFVFKAAGESWNEYRQLLPRSKVSFSQFGSQIADFDGKFAVASSQREVYNYIYDFKQPQISKPVTVTSGGEQEFTWHALDADIAEWWLYIGSSALRPKNYFDSGSLASDILSVNVANLPVDGSNIYAKLWYQLNGDSSWYYTDANFSAYGLRPQIASHESGSQLAGASDTITWNGNDSGASEYWLNIGSSLGGNDYLNSGNLGDSTSLQVSGLPDDGTSDLYFRLWYRVSGGPWLYIDDTFLAGTGEAARPAITSPVSTESLTDSSGSEMFQWSSVGNDTDYWLFVGSVKGGKQYYDSGNLDDTAEAVVSGLPTNGSKVWIRLWYRISGVGVWQYIDEEYEAYGTGPSIDSASDSAILAYPNDTFDWADPTGTATDWWLYVGSTVGASDYENSGNLGSDTSYTTRNGSLPTGSVPVYVRLWYRQGSGVWEYIDRQFVSAP